MRKIKEYILIVLHIAILVIMCFKDSITLTGSNGVDMFTSYYSYFDLIVFGMGNGFALFSAVLNILIIILNFLDVIFNKKYLRNINYFIDTLFIIFFVFSLLITNVVTIHQWIMLSILIIECLINFYFLLKEKKFQNN